MTTPTFTLLDGRIDYSYGDAKVRFNYLVKLADGRRMRFLIYVDGYVEQSYGLAQLWADERGWVDVVKLSGRELELDLKLGYSKGGGDERHFTEDYDRLKKMVKLTLALS